jgi:hypothetical protein
MSCFNGQCHGSSRYFQASHRVYPPSIPGHPCEVGGGQRNTGTGFSPSTSICHHCSILAFLLMLLLSEGQAGEGWEPSNKLMFFRISGSIGHKSIFTWFFKFQSFKQEMFIFHYVYVEVIQM